MAEEPEDLEWQLESRLTGDGVYLTDFAREEALELTYESVAVDETGTVPHREVGRIIQTVQEVFGEDWRGERLEATATDLDGEPRGEWHVAEEWFAALAEEELSEVEFSQRVVDTIEPVDG